MTMVAEATTGLRVEAFYYLADSAALRVSRETGLDYEDCHQEILLKLLENWDSLEVYVAAAENPDAYVSKCLRRWGNGLAKRERERLSAEFGWAFFSTAKVKNLLVDWVHFEHWESPSSPGDPGEQSKSSRDPAFSSTDRMADLASISYVWPYMRESDQDVLVACYGDSCPPNTSDDWNRVGNQLGKTGEATRKAHGRAINRLTAKLNRGVDYE